MTAVRCAEKAAPRANRILREEAATRELAADLTTD